MYIAIFLPLNFLLVIRIYVLFNYIWYNLSTDKEQFLIIFFMAYSMLGVQWLVYILHKIKQNLLQLCRWYVNP
jgi:hypothetical protein